jgi:plastocyanin
MRSPRPASVAALVAAVAVAVAVAACSSAAPSWTYAPAPSPTPVPSVAASAAPSAGASAAPSSSPSASQAPTGTVLEISAQNIKFDTTTLEAPADEAFQIAFQNNDAGVQHNVEIRDASGKTVFLGEIFNGVDSRTYQVDPLPAGTYQFICTVHPNMVGTLTVK